MTQKEDGPLADDYSGSGSARCCAVRRKGQWRHRDGFLLGEGLINDDPNDDTCTGNDGRTWGMATTEDRLMTRSNIN